MEYRNCPECGKVFAYIRTNLCPSCLEKDEKNFRMVRQYIAKNPGVDISTVSQETGVDESVIIRYLRDGRLSIGNDIQNIQLKCEVCGALISAGKLCKACNEKLTAGMKKQILEENKRQLEEMKARGPRMHTADYWLKRDKD